MKTIQTFHRNKGAEAGIRARRLQAFTLLELLVAITILALLASLSAPAMQAVMRRARSTQCGSNLRQVGIAVLASLADHNNYFPEIETDPSNPVYPPSEGAKGMLDTLSPYGVTSSLLQCPEDMNGPNAKHDFKRTGTSYEWRPLLDGENNVAPKVYWHSTPSVVSSQKIRISTDFERYHFGKMNALYGDGHIVQALK